MAREDLEDDPRAIDDLALGHLLEVAHLRARQRPVEDDEARADAVGQGADLLDLALADEAVGRQLLPALDDAAADADLERVEQRAELREIVVQQRRVLPDEEDADDDGRALGALILGLRGRIFLDDAPPLTRVSVQRVSREMPA
jgi:hypothetical protein